MKRDAGEGKIGTVAGIRQLEKLHLSEYTIDVNQLSQKQSSMKPRAVKKKSTQDSWFAPSAADNKKVRAVSSLIADCAQAVTEALADRKARMLPHYAHAHAARSITYFPLTA